MDVQDARGDQCDKCTNMLNPTDLINPRCKATGTQPVLRTTRHMFLDLPQLSPQLQEWIDATSALGGWTSNGLKVPALVKHWNPDRCGSMALKLRDRPMRR